MIFIMALFLISLLLESLVPNIIREFIPFFIIGAIVISSAFLNNKNKCLLLIFIFGVLYDLFYTDLLVFNGFIFSVLFLLSNLIIKDKKNFFLMIITYYLLMILYSIFMSLFSFIYISINIENLINIIIKSLSINSLYFITIYLLFIGIKCLICNRRKKRTY